MSVPFPDLLDPRKAAAQRATFAGELGIRRLPRLSAMLLPAQSTPLRTGQQPAVDEVARYRFAFTLDADRRARVTGQVVALLPLRCQRCFERVDLAVESQVELAVVAGIDEANALPGQLEPLLVDDRLMRPADLIEDELILAIPAIPRHPEGQCEPPGVSTDHRAPAEQPSSSAEPKPHPFAGLALVKTRNDQQDDPDPQG
jgi:uncharacterized protein